MRIYFWSVEENECQTLIASEEYTRPEKSSDYMLELWDGYELFEWKLPIPDSRKDHKLTVVMKAYGNIFNRIRVALKHIISGHVHTADFNITHEQYRTISKYIYAGTKYIIRCSSIGHHGLILLPYMSDEKGKMYSVSSFTEPYGIKIRISQAIEFILHKQVVIDSYLTYNTKMLGTYNVLSGENYKKQEAVSCLNPLCVTKGVICKSKD